MNPKPPRGKSGVHLDERDGVTAATGFDVTVEAVIGHVNLGIAGVSPMEAAMAVIGRYHEQQTTDSLYRFPGPDEDEVITVTISHSRS